MGEKQPFGSGGELRQITWSCTCEYGRPAGSSASERKETDHVEMIIPVLLSQPSLADGNKRLECKSSGNGSEEKRGKGKEREGKS